MQSAARHPDTEPRFELRFDGGAEGVRQALVSLRHWLVQAGCPEPVCGKIELALAEVLNNIIEHAYLGDPAGWVQFVVEIQTESIACHVADAGIGLPEGQIPKPNPPKTAVAVGQLPEGGFGWFLIHSLTENLSYRREDGINHLDLWIAL